MFLQHPEDRRRARDMHPQWGALPLCHVAPTWGCHSLGDLCLPSCTHQNPILWIFTQYLLNMAVEGKQQVQWSHHPTTDFGRIWRDQVLWSRACDSPPTGHPDGRLTHSSLSLGALLSARRGGKVFGDRHGLVPVIWSVTHRRAFLPWGDKEQLEFLWLWWPPRVVITTAWPAGRLHTYVYIYVSWIICGDLFYQNERWSSDILMVTFPRQWPNSHNFIYDISVIPPPSMATPGFI